VNVLQVARDWRRRLQQLEDQAVREAAARYRHAAQASVREIEGIATRIAAAERPVSVTDLFTQYRLGTVRKDLEAQLTGWATGEGPRIQAVVDQAASLAPGVALEMIRSRLQPQLPAAVAASLVRHRPDETAQIIASLTKGSPLTDLLVKAAGERAQQAAQTLVTGVALNQDPRRVAKDLGRVIDGGVTRARLITRTEMLRVTREAQRQQWLAGNAVSGWTWWSTLDKTTCMVCWAMHGSHHKLEEPFGSHPACRCSMIPEVKAIPGVPAADPIRTGPDKFANLPPGDQRRVLGPTRHDKYLAGDLELPDVVQYHDDPRWGPTRTQAPVTGSTPPVAPAAVAPAISPHLNDDGSISDRMDIYAAKSGIKKKVLDGVQRAIHEIDKLLRVPNGLLERIPVDYESRRGTAAFYQHSTRYVGEGANYHKKLVRSRLGIGTGAQDNPVTTFTHEFGHYMDFEVLHGTEYLVSAAAKAAQEQWVARIKAGETLTGATEELAAWYSAANSPELRARIGAAYSPGGKLHRYFLSPEEMFARSFEQWVALRSGDPALVAEIHNKWRTLNYSTDHYWTDDEFTPIAEALDEYFTRKGMLR